MIFGNDQMELFGNGLMPAFFVYAGETIENGPVSEERKAKMEPGIAISLDGHKPKQRVDYPGLPEHAQHVIRTLLAEEFDVAVSNKLPTGPRGSADIPHAFGFVYERIMKGKVVPNLPLFTNTFYPPNQPSAKRCFRFGDVVAEAMSEIKNWIPLAAVMTQTQLVPTVIDYVPCYRSEAGTGNAMAFLYWQ